MSLGRTLLGALRRRPRELRFACTACGKCCHGWLPLTLDEALIHAGVFPLAMVWRPIPRGAKPRPLAEQFGALLRRPDAEDLAVWIVPTADLPPGFPCPMLTAENLCRVQTDKPLRCRTMPFYPYQEEGDQAAYLAPRPGWTCDTSAAAPVVYRDGRIVSPGDFDRERAAMACQTRELRAYAEVMLTARPSLAAEVAAATSKGGAVVLSFASYAAHATTVDAHAFAERQLPVLAEYGRRTAGRADLAAHHARYQASARETERLLRAT